MGPICLATINRWIITGFKLGIPSRHTMMESYTRMSYSARLYYTSSGIHTWEVYFVIMKDLESHRAVSIFNLTELYFAKRMFGAEVYLHCRLLMPCTLRLILHWVLIRRWCLKGKWSLWIFQRKGLCWRKDGLSLHTHILGWVQSTLAYQYVCSFKMGHEL